MNGIRTGAIVLCVVAAGVSLRAEEAKEMRNTLALVEKGIPLSVIEVGEKWKRGDGHLECSGMGNCLTAGRTLGAGDFHVRVRLSIEELSDSAASFVMDGDHFGFDGADHRIFVEGPTFGATRFVADAKDFFTPGKPFDFEVIRRGEALTDRIDGREVWTTETKPRPVENWGLRPWRSTMRVADFSVTGGIGAPWVVSTTPKTFTIPLIDLSQETKRQVVVARGTKDVYQGHPTTVLMGDGQTMYAVWTYDHGGPCGPMKKSADGGLTWSELLPVPDDWKTIRNCPAIYRLTDPKGKERLLVFAAGSGTGSMWQAMSEDGGKTWSPMKRMGIPCVMPFCAVEPIRGGRHLAMYHRGNSDRDRSPLRIWQTISEDGGLTWKEPRMVAELAGADPCEPALIRSPNGKQLLCLMRENRRRLNSLMMVSDDEGETWSELRELPASLTGDRHAARYAPDGRLVVAFRDMAADSPTKGHFAGWVGAYDDIIAGREGQCRLLLLRQHGRLGDCGYPGLEVLPDGTLVTTTYVVYRSGGEKNSVVSVRFNLDEIDAKAAELPKKTVLFAQGQGGYNNTRIPALIVTKRGTLLAFAEGREGGDSGDIDTLLRRSEDGGRTWSEAQVVWDDGPNTCGNPCPVVDRETGRVFLLSTWNRGDDHEGTIIRGTSKDTRRVFICHSDDDGKTWSKPRDITASAKRKEWGWYATGPGVGIQLERGINRGRLVIPCDNSYPDAEHPVIDGKFGYGSHVIYSDDRGETWHISDLIRPGCNESQAVELADGTLMINMRSYNKKGCRAVATSADGGRTWSEIRHAADLPESVCQASFLRLSTERDGGRNRLLFSNPAVTEGRSRMTVRVSCDEGQTWPASKLLHGGPAAYSCLAVLPDGDIGCFYEAGERGAYETMVFARFTLQWLAGDEDWDAR
ncbi:MAG TPA: sialidase family protein [Sumerlaeia bacterium]|nr:sialidase family protein [Sumerlaeia bacterium]